jgi:hypothetical protein
MKQLIHILPAGASSGKVAACAAELEAAASTAAAHKWKRIRFSPKARHYYLGFPQEIDINQGCVCGKGLATRDFARSAP